jgi:hypothetical protein
VKRLADRRIDKFKARLVAQGFTQRPGFNFDETDTTIIRFDLLQLLLAITAVQGWCPQKVDIKCAFLYSNLKEEIYLILPKGR